MKAVSAYVSKDDWRCNENANSTYSHPGMMQYIANKSIAKYWMNNIYPEGVKECVKKNRFHIHDLGFLSAYCSGWSTEDILTYGFGGVPNKIQCRPPKRLNTALNQIVNFLFTLQGELAGAQALSNFDTLLAPFIRVENLTYRDVFKYLQSFVYSLNVPTRSGFQSPFTNISFDLRCPERYRHINVIIGGEARSEWTYDMFQEEMDMLNRAFTDVMTQGDGNGAIFSFPIPTYTITKDFDWDDKNLKPMWKMTAKYGIPYFANFVNSDLNPDDFRSMCCRLRLDTRELHRRQGGLFGSTPLTGSVGVVTLNLPNIARMEGDFYTNLDSILEQAKVSLEIKRDVVEYHIDLYPFAAFYLKSVYERSGKYWSNHFSTIGVCGMNEACMVKFGDGIYGHGDWALEVLEHIKTKLKKFQDETGNLYNLEATLAESTSYKFALHDREQRPGDETIPPYYTNSTALPVDATDDVFDALNHQEQLQCAYTGGTVFHAYIGEELTRWQEARDFVRFVTHRYRIPYVSLTPTFTICKNHGYQKGAGGECGCAADDLLTYSRIVGYYRPVRDWNRGKKLEYEKRECYNIELPPPPIENIRLDIGGFIKTSLIDSSDGPVSVVFLQGCNLQCPWCHNRDMEVDETLTAAYVLQVVTKGHRRLVISGGEPTLQPDLIPFLRILKQHGVFVKLDTNGTMPGVLETIFKEDLVEFVAMDIKGSFDRYGEITGIEHTMAVEPIVDNIKRSMELIDEYNVSCMYRTTAVPHLVSTKDIEDCVGTVGKHSYRIQKYRGVPDDHVAEEEYKAHYDECVKTMKKLR